MNVVLREARETAIGITSRTERAAEDTLRIVDITAGRTGRHAVQSGIVERIEASHAGKAQVGGVDASKARRDAGCAHSAQIVSPSWTVDHTFVESGRILVKDVT